MKKIYALIALAITSFGFAQGTETFTNIANSNNYGIRTWTGDNGMSWNATDSREDQTVTGKAITVRTGVLTGNLNSTQANAGVGVVTFDYKIPFSDATKNITVVITAGEESFTYNIGTLTMNTVYNSIPIELNAETADNLTFTVSSSSSGARLAIDNISWTAYEPEETPVEPVAPTASFDLQEALTISPSLDDASSFFGNAVVTIANLGEGQTASLSLENTENFEIITPEVTDLGNGTHSIQIRFNAQGLAANTYTTNLNVEIASQTTALATLEIVGVVSPALSNNLNTIEGLNIYPNPANDVVTITSAANGVKNVQLFDVTGKQIMNVETSSTINVSSLAKGIYVMKVTEAGKSATSKLVIK